MSRGVEDRAYAAEDAQVYPLWGAYDTAMRETCSRTPDTRECQDWVYCKKYPEAWMCERSVLREALMNLVDLVAAPLLERAGDFMFWVARRLRR